MDSISLRASAIVLAAGKSSRMGKNKLLLEIRGRTILDHILYALKESDINEIIVVLGNDPAAIKSIADTHGVKTVLNTEYEKGMTSSFQTGLRETTTDATFLVLGDQMGLDPALLERMIELMRSDPDTQIISLIHNGKRGHPVLFRRPLFREIMDLDENQTMKDLVLRHKMEHKTIEGGLWCTIDFDTPADFKRVKMLFEANHDES